MMLGMNAPKAVAKGEYAKAIRKAVHDSIEAIKNGKVPEKKIKSSILSGGYSGETIHRLERFN